MKKLLFITFLILSVTLFMFKTQAFRANRVSFKPGTEASSEEVITKDSKERKDLKNVLTFQKTKYDKLKASIRANVEADGPMKMSLLANPSFVKLFSTGDANNRALIGFFGAKYDMFEMYIREAKAEPQNGRIAVQGLTRVGDHICEINGFYYVDAAGKNKTNPGEKNIAQNICCKGHFEFTETQKGKNTGNYHGVWYADISRAENSDREVELQWENGMTNRNGKIELGVWKSASTGNEKDICVSANLFEVGKEVFGVFEYGGRDISLKEPYASRGWKKYYEYEEWWAPFVAKK